MKKTLITLLALAGVATADSLDYDTYKNQATSPYLTNLETVFDFDQTSGTTANKAGGPTGAYSYKPTIAYATGNTTDGYGVIDDNQHQMYKDGVSWGDFTISMDVNTMEAGHLLTIKDADSKMIYLTSTAATQDTPAKPLTLTYDSVEGSVVSSVSPTTGSLTLNWTTITLVRSLDTLTLYVNGVKQGDLEGSAAKITAFQIGSRFGGGEPVAPIDATIDNFTVWSRALSSNEVRGLIVPEPTTATLSLLALAGLAARRRRR